MEDNEYFDLKIDIQRIIEGIGKFVDGHRDDDKCLYELRKCVDKAKWNKCSWNKEKVQIILEILQLKNHSDMQEILSYLERSSYGWQGHTYRLYNSCLRFEQHCRKNYRIDNNPEQTERAFADIDKVFLHEEYGALTTYLFGYCLAALFSSRLKNQNRGIPYFLQIACKRNSNTYRLVHEIVHICDVNAGLYKYCDGVKYKECNHDHMTIYPSEIEDKSLSSLLYYQDIPVIVEGYENEKLYEVLLREVANIPRKTKRLDLKAKFNVLPVFLCPMVQSQFRNFFSMDLTSIDITDEYIELVNNNGQRLGSWVFELVMDAKEYFDNRNASGYSTTPEIAKIIQMRTPEDEIPLFYDLDNHCSNLGIKYNRETKLTSTDITNIGYLSYFFSYYMKVFNGSIQLPKGAEFTYRTHYDKHNPEKIIEQIKVNITESLVHLHNTYSPMVPETMNFEIDSSNKAELKRIRRKGIDYAKNIVEYYQSYHVFIRISNVEYKDGRYVFSAKLMPGTNKKLIRSHVEDVRSILDVEVLALDISAGDIKLILSETPLNNNNLIKILESAKFKESEMEIPYAIGYDIMGEMVIADVSEFPHLLIGGASGFGKSSALHSLLMSIIYKQPAEKVKLLLFDFGASGLKMFDKVPHMLQPTIRSSETEKGRQCLVWLKKEMEERLKKKDSFEEKKFMVEFKKWPSIVCVIDEFPAFVRQLTEGKGNKNAHIIIVDLLERARKVKIHLVLAAQNASKGNIKIGTTNLGASIAFKCKTRYDSEAIIESSDAVTLSAKGAMYLKCYLYDELKRVQGSFMPPIEIMDMLEEMEFHHDDNKKLYDEIKFISQPLPKTSIDVEDSDSSVPEDASDELLEQIIMLALKKGKISNKFIMSNFEMGFERANGFLKSLEEVGIIEKLRGKKERKFYPDRAKEFLGNRGYVENTDEGEWIKDKIDLPGMQNTETVTEISNVQEQTVDSHMTKSPAEMGQAFKDMIKKNNLKSPKKSLTK